MSAAVREDLERRIAAITGRGVMTATGHARATRADVSTPSSVAIPAFHVKERPLEILWPEWPQPIAHVESRSRAGHWYTADVGKGTCECQGYAYRKRCEHLTQASVAYTRDVAAEMAEQQAARERAKATALRRQLQALLSEYGEGLFHRVVQEVAS